MHSAQLKACLILQEILFDLGLSFLPVELIALDVLVVD